MIVLPCSQLTMRMVPASTFRRNDETMSGITPSTPTRTAATIISVSVIWNPLRERPTVYEVSSRRGQCERLWRDCVSYLCLRCGLRLQREPERQHYVRAESEFQESAVPHLPIREKSIHCLWNRILSRRVLPTLLQIRASARAGIQSEKAN